MYSELHPRVMELLRVAGKDLKDLPPIAPGMLHVEPEPDPVIYFEDLTPQARLNNAVLSLSRTFFVPVFGDFFSGLSVTAG